MSMDNFEHREKPPITKEEREAKKERARQEAEIALAARKKEDEAFRANFERLKAERMAREASETKS
jgi:sarcosine oxidase gamma subunit